MQMRTVLLVAAALAAVLAPSPAAAKRPNIIFLLTDDLDLRLGSMTSGAMASTMALLKGGGANMTNYFVVTPVCCPSRATFLSGRYEHNNRVDKLDATPACMRQNTSQTSNPAFWQNSFVPLLHDAGYTTGFFGKMLNVMDDYGCNGPKGLPRGLDKAHFMCSINYYNSEWCCDNSGKTFHTGRRPEEYTTSLIGNYSLNWIQSIVQSGADHKPFFAYLGPHAPHLPSTPAEWDMNNPVGQIKAPRDTPYYNYSALDHHHLLAAQPILNDADAEGIDHEYSLRLRSLVAVDDIVRQLHAYLTSVGEWDNTIFFFSSDHGYSQGQFRITSHKTQVYDHNTRVPFLVAGPQIPAGLEVPVVAQMVDVGPTILDLAGVPVPASMDGRSFARFLHGSTDTSDWKDTAIIEYQSIHPIPQGRHPHDEANNTFSALRIINATHNLLYAEFVDVEDPAAWNFPPDKTNFYELYDVNNDYYQLHNIYNTASDALKKELSTRLHELIHCRGQSECP